MSCCERPDCPHDLHWEMREKHKHDLREIVALARCRELKWKLRYEEQEKEKERDS